MCKFFFFKQNASCKYELYSPFVKSSYNNKLLVND